MNTTKSPPGVYLWSKIKNIEIKDDGKLYIDGKNDNEVNADISQVDKIQNFAKKYSRDFYSKNILSKQYENLIVLSGAGTSIGCGRDSTKGKSLKDLYSIVESSFEGNFDIFCEKCNFDKKELGENLELLMSAANIAENFFRHEDEKKEIRKGIDSIEKIIRKQCTIKLNEESDPHILFVNKIIKRKLKYPRSKLFTVNYDTLFEQACALSRCYVIDGFTYSNPRIFNGRNFDYDFVIRENSRIKDEENFIPKVLHLYKMHGSLGWEVKENIIKQSGNNESSVMIFPRENKYEQSYDQPFFEMMSRFQLELRRSDILLICVGFSFSDKHIYNVIKEALKQNPGFQLLIVDPDIGNENFKYFKESADKDSRVTLIKENFKDFTNFYPENKSVTQDERMRNQYENG